MKPNFKLFALAIAIAFPFAAHSQTINTIAGNGTQAFTGNGGPATSCSFDRPEGIAFDKKGNTYIADLGNSCIRKIDHFTGIITNFAGTGTPGYSGDGGPATGAMLKGCAALTFDSVGNLYIADNGNHRIRKVDTFGVITTVAGNGVATYAGDGGPALSASFFVPDGVAFDKHGNLYIVDAGNKCVRKINTTGIVSTVAGTGGVTGFSGDGGAASSAILGQPEGIAIDKNDNIYIVDAPNYRLRKVNPAGIISTFAGTGTDAFSGDSVSAATSSIGMPGDVAVDSAGNVYFTEYTSERVRKVNSSGIMTTVGGSGTYGFSGDGGPAKMANFNGPTGIAVTKNGTIVFSDMWNQRIRTISYPTPATQIGVTMEQEDMTVFPNPSDGVFNIRMARYQGDCHVNVYNTVGDIVFTQNASIVNALTVVELRNYPSGIYVLELLTPRQVTRTRITVMGE